MPTSPVIVEMYGDSTTWGSTELPDGTWIQSPSNVPAVLQSKYGSNVVVVNKGIPGLTIPEFAIGAAPAKMTWAQAMAISPAHIVGINLGINDANAEWETDYVVNYYLGQLIDVAQAAGKTVFIETANPIDNPLYDRLSEIALVTRTLAQSRALTLADHHLWIQTGLPNWQSYLPDGKHPNAALYTFKAENLYTIVNPLIQWRLAQ